MKKFISQHLFGTDARPGVSTVVILALICLIAIISTNPLGNFALNDDWFYYRAVQSFSWAAWHLDSAITPALMGQVFYGALLTKIFGFSFPLLRLSTLLLALIALFFFFKLLRNRGAGNSLAILATLIIFFNPLFYNLSFTFMTDVPALSLIIIALYFYDKFNHDHHDWQFLLAQFLTIYACAIRQNYFPILIFSGLLLINKKNKLKYWLEYFGSLIFAGALYFFLVARGWWPSAAIDLHSFSSLTKLISNALWQIYFIWHYLALFLAPLIIVWFFNADKKAKLYSLALGGVGVLTTLILFFTKHLTFPYFKNIINIYGLGARGIDLVLTGTPMILIKPWLGLALTLIAGFLAGTILALALTSAIDKFKNKNSFANISQKKWTIFLLLNFLAQAGIVMVLVSFDRYYLPLLIFALLLILPAIAKLRVNWLAWIVLTMMALISVSCTFNYLSEQKVKWQIADSLVSANINVNQIDAGYEWFGWNTYAGNVIANKTKTNQPWYIKEYFPNNTREYVVSYNSELKNYNLIKSFTYPRLLLRPGKLYLLTEFRIPINY